MPSLTPSLTPSLAQRLAEIVGPTHVLTDPELTASYEVDWTGRFRGRAAVVVRPGSTSEVAAVLRECPAAGVPVVPQGGNTGLVGGSVPVGVPGAVLLSMRRLAWLGPVDEAAGQVWAGAGATVAAVAGRAREAGWDLGLDLASRDSATVGGAVATNAGGERVLRYGPARAQVAGIEAVLADGRVLARPGSGGVLSGGVVRESAGYDLGALLAGSEGTLAVMTAVRLRLVPLLPYRVVAVVGVADTAAALRALAAVRRRAAGLSAAELFHADGLALVRAHTGLPLPLGAEHPSYLLVECAGRADPTDALAAALDGLPEVRDAAVATDPPGREALWRYREAHPEAVGAVGIPVKLDIAVPPAVLPAAESAIRAAVLAVAPSAQVIVWGHLAVANLHVNVLSAQAHADEVTDAVLRTVAAHDGSISAEHGIGRAKARWLTLTRSPTEIAAMRAVKSALDPRGLLNPGVLFAPDR
jgi:FAD/FMN-containing dehydrogenase